MKILLDTHIWLWSLLEPARLPKRIAKALAAPGNQLYISPISLWEVLALCDRGRLALDPTPQAWIERALTAVPAATAPLTAEVALATAEVRTPHRDPADRLLAATARVHHLTLATADQQLLAGRGYRTL